ncbi:hypothetical protein [Corallococcus carmarthensis]|uniref:Uncharacterized protein n=1 Tax=Corallococcus carmarthensis TaxID=2316728 RepID=A0A3A8KXT1_9BACT|nr:hypothetical protein [Corallococcus carmarthensis]NOK17613.1 hypothetical protein [Corallococcus carmarthensis]RKH06794.1 hypothetical protein D7X32_04035 [Corallococcus carmarthensis]
MSLLQKLMEHPSLHAPCGTAAKRALLKASLPPSAATRQVDGDLTLSEGTDLLVEEGSLHVKGHLLLDDQSRLLVAGDVVVEGNIVHEGFDYALLFAGGSIQADNLLFHGELVALEGLTLRGAAWTYYNDYSTYADTLTARAVVADDRADAVDQLHADTHLQGHAQVIAGALEQLLHPEAWARYQQGSYAALAKHLRQGQPLLRDSHPRRK